VHRNGWILTTFLLLACALSTARAQGVEESRVRLHLRTGSKISGIVRGGLEVLVSRSFRPASNEGADGAGYRVWYSTGTNGFIFVPRRDIVRVENLGAVTNEQRKALDQALADLRQAAQQSRLKAREDLVALRERQRAEEEVEEGLEEAVEEALEAETEEEEALAAARRAEDEARRQKGILDRFPPPSGIRTARR
jgi:flagellar biosynthesis GTPase FlhF